MSETPNAEKRPGRNVFRPWTVSLWYAAAAIPFTLLLYGFPEWRWLPLPSGTPFPTPALVMLLPIVALVWAILGIVRRKTERGLIWCLLSIGVTAGVIYFIATAFWNDPFREKYIEQALPASAAQDQNP